MATMTLEELVRQLSLVHGESLRCVALYGSMARGEQVSRRPNLNVLVLVDAIDMAHLQREAAVARALITSRLYSGTTRTSVAFQS